MSLHERVASSQMSSNLRESRTGLGDVDILRASGMVSKRNPLGMSLFRLKYAEIESEIPFCLAELSKLVMDKRGLDKDKARRVASRVLAHYLGDRCDDCGGTGYTLIPGTPTLSDAPCPVCKGQGILKFDSKNQDELWLQAEISFIETAAAADIMMKLRDAMF